MDLEEDVVEEVEEEVEEELEDNGQQDEEALEEMEVDVNWDMFVSDLDSGDVERDLEEMEVGEGEMVSEEVKVKEIHKLVSHEERLRHKFRAATPKPISWNRRWTERHDKRSSLLVKVLLCNAKNAAAKIY